MAVTKTIDQELLQWGDLWAWTAESKHLVEASILDERPRVVIETPEQLEEVVSGWLDEVFVKELERHG